MTTVDELARIRGELKLLVEQKEEVRRLTRSVDTRALNIRVAMEQAGLTELLGDGVRGLIYDTTSTRSDVELAREILTKEQFDMIFTCSPGRAFKASRT